MKVISTSEDIGLIWYTADDYTGTTKHVICYGLQVSIFDSEEEAQDFFRECLDHHFYNG